MIEIVELASRLLLVIGLYVSATLMCFRATDITSGEDENLPGPLRYQVARGWWVALFSMGVWQWWWLASWVVEAKGGNPMWFRENSEWLVIPIMIAALALFSAIAPYASRITPHWDTLTKLFFSGVVVVSGLIAVYVAM